MRPTSGLDWATMMYFSFTVLTSTGFGEITPVTDMARALIVVEQVLGVMYVAFLIARLANRYGTTGAAGGVRGRCRVASGCSRTRTASGRPA